MKINNVGLKFTNEPGKRTSTTAIVLHHAEANGCTVQDIHRWHLGNGWAGIGYHFYVRKDGSVYQGRPIDWIGAHAGASSGYNKKSVGICFEGKYDSTDKSMPAAQLKAGQELVSYVKSKYPTIKEIKKHSECTATSCPGKYFPFAEIAKGSISTVASVAKPTTSNNVKNNGGFEMKTYKNGSTKEYVYKTVADCKAQKTAKSIGYLDQWESCSCYGKIDGVYLVVYNAGNTKKTGFVKYSGGVK